MKPEDFTKIARAIHRLSQHESGRTAFDNALLDMVDEPGVGLR